ncbi:hypothetical protein ACFLU6_05500 [Acidobacteriota bacterium]
MTREQDVPTCPYCTAILKKSPQRKTKCHSCSNPIFVKTLPSTREKVLVTHARAQEIEREWQTRSERARWLQIVEPFGVTAKIFDHVQQELAGKTNQPESYKKAAWILLKRALIAETNLQNQKSLHYNLALILEEDNLDFRPHLEKAAELGLLHLKESCRSLPDMKVKILAGELGDSCKACVALSKKTFTIDEALNLRPLPCKECTTILNGSRPGFCRCEYTAYSHDWAD